MILLGLDAFGVPHDALWIGNVQLGSHVRNNSHRNIDRISEKGSLEPERSNSNPKAQTIVLSTTLGKLKAEIRTKEDRERKQGVIRFLSL